MPDTSPVDSPPPSWAPTAISGLALWLDAAVGVTLKSGTVELWADRSGNGNSVGQSDMAHQPTAAMGVVNGLPVVRFASAGDQYLIALDSTSLQFGKADFTVMVVVAYTNTPSGDQNLGYAALFVKSDPTPPFPGAALFGNDPNVPNASVHAQVASTLSVDSSGTSYNDGKFHYVGSRRTGTTLEVRGDGAQAGTVADPALTDLSAIGSNLYIGGRNPLDGANQALQGDIAEVVAVKGTVSDPDLSKLETYLKTKYAL